MGNHQGRITYCHIDSVLEKTNQKAHWILHWYLRERNIEESIFLASLKTICIAFLDNRSIGAEGLAKLLPTVSPALRIPGKQGKVAAVIASTLDLRDIGDGEEVRKHLKQLGKDSARNIDVFKDLTDSLKSVIHRMSRNFITEPREVKLQNLIRWSCLVVTLIIVHIVVRGRGSARSIMEGYLANLDRFKRACIENQKKNMTFAFHDESYFTYPAAGQKRWWIDGYLKIIESNPFFVSSAHKFDHICLTKGHPRSFGFDRGIIRSEEYIAAWDCQDGRCTTDEIRTCIKCTFVEHLVDSALLEPVMEVIMKVFH